MSLFKKVMPTVTDLEDRIKMLEVEQSILISREEKLEELIYALAKDVKLLKEVNYKIANIIGYEKEN